MEEVIRIITRRGVMGHKIKQFSILPHEEANRKMRYGEFRFKIWLNMFCIFSKILKVMFFYFRVNLHPDQGHCILVC